MARYSRVDDKLYDSAGRMVKDLSNANTNNNQMIMTELPDGTFDVSNVEISPAIIDAEVKDNTGELLTIDGGAEVSSKTILSMLKTRPEEVLSFLLSKQSNKHPLKKGGSSIAYKCEALILATRLNLNSYENLLFDIILGRVSSYPEDDVYTIYVSDYEPYLPYKDRRYVNKIFREAKEGLFEKGIKISIPNNDLDLTFHLIGPSAFKGPKEIKETDKSSFLSFTLDPIVKALIISSGYTHGAYYRIEWSSRLLGYAKILFFYLEDLKTYKAYPDAKPGVIFMTTSQVREILGIPNTYKTGDIKTKILDPAIKKINKIEGIDIYASVTSKYSSGKLAGYLFEIESIFELEKGEESARIEDKSATFTVEENILAASSYSEKDIRTIIKVYAENKRDIQFLMRAIVLTDNVANEKGVASKTKYLCSILKNGITTSTEKKKSTNNKFKNFDERSYDYDELEKQLLESNPPSQY